MSTGMGEEGEVVPWAEVPAEADLKTRMYQLVVDPVRRPERLRRLNVTPISGLLLHGPSGCGKTLLARSVARETGSAALFVQAPRLLKPYLGQSEQAVRLVFKEARELAPAIIILDQLDVIAAQRSFASSDDAQAHIYIYIYIL
jgi:SpoVK/Ycf46/Vps4 family AAA+-type ATPase